MDNHGARVEVMVMDERVLTILKEVAQEHTQDSDSMDLSCVFCSGDRDYSVSRVDNIVHEANCPTVLARMVLREMGTPLHVYQITYDRVLPYFPVHTIRDDLRTGFTEDDVKKLYQDKSLQNVQIVYIKDM
jgi:hypothetical protein